MYNCTYLMLFSFFRILKYKHVSIFRGFPGGSMIKNLLTMQERRLDPCVAKIPWRRKWQPTPVFLPGGSHGHRSLADYSPWDHRRMINNLTAKQYHLYFGNNSNDATFVHIYQSLRIFLLFSTVSNK